MDDVNDEDSAMMHNLGFILSAKNIPYEGSKPCTAFVATVETVRFAIRERAKQMNIGLTVPEFGGLK